MRRMSALPGWLGLFLGVWLLLRGGGPAASTKPNATRMLAYPLDEAVDFALAPGDHEIKLVSWLLREDDWPRDVRATVPYCVAFTVRDPAGRQVRRWPIFIRARDGLMRTSDGHLHDPNWLPDDAGSVSDDRLTQLDLGGLTPEGGTLTVSPCWTPPGARILATLFQRGDTTLAQRLRVLRGEESGWHRAVADRISPFPWWRLPPVWKENLVSQTWERLGALQEGTVRVPTEPVMTTFHKGSWLDESALGVPVPPGGALAFNVEGPTVFEGSWWTPEDRVAVGVPTELRVFRGGTGSGTASGKVHRVGPIAVGNEVVSIQVALAADAPGPLVFKGFTSGGDLDRAWGDPPRESPDGREAQRVAPDFRNLELYRALPADPHTPPLRFPVEEGEWVRVLAFARLPPQLPGLFAAPPATGSVRMLVRCVDALGEVLSLQELGVSREPSLFERYTQFDTPATAAPSVPSDLYLQPPPGTAALEIVADAVVDVGVRVLLEPDLKQIVWRGYEFEEGFDADGRWVPLVRNPWRTRAPEDLEHLVRTLRAPRIDAQVRLEEEEIEEARPTQRVSIQQWSLPLWEPFELLAEPGAGSFVRLGRAPVTVTVAESGRLHLEYRVDPKQVGATLTVRLGDATVTRKLAAATGSLRFDGLAPGPLKVVVELPGLFLARSDGHPRWRTVRAVRAPGEPQRAIEVPAGPWSLAVHPYAARGGGRLRWRLTTPTGAVLDGGSMPLSPRGGGAVPLSFAGDGLLALEPLRLRRQEGDPAARLYVWVEGAEVLLRATSSTPQSARGDTVLRPMGPAR